MAHTVPESKKRELDQLFDEFRRSYLTSRSGGLHAAAYGILRQDARRNYGEILASVEQGSEITRPVLTRLLPHSDTAAHRAEGAWIHIAPAIVGDIQTWYEAAGWTHPHDWPAIAWAILRFVQRCVEEIDDACQDFAALPYSKGLQSGMMSPILNALDPDAYLLFNSKSRQCLNYFTETRFGPTLGDYPAANRAMQALVVELPSLQQVAAERAMRPADLFDMFCHWLVSVRRFEFRTPRYWQVAIADDLWLWREWQEGSYVALAWDELGDLADVSRREFEQRRDSLIAQYETWTKRASNEVWRFARQPHEGDTVIVVLGIGTVLGIGQITGPYYYVGEASLGHRLSVEWQDLTIRALEQPAARINSPQLLTELSGEEFEQMRTAPTKAYDLADLFAAEDGPEDEGDPGWGDGPRFLRYCIPLLEALRDLDGEGEIEDVVGTVGARLDLSQHEGSVQLPGGVSQIRSQVHRARRLLDQVGVLTSERQGVWQLTRAGWEADLSPSQVMAWFRDVEYERKVARLRGQDRSAPRHVADLPTTYEADGEFGSADAIASQPAYSLGACAETIGVDEAEVARWVRAVERKGQIIFYGAPGTGKTFAANQLARHLIGEGDGFADLVQFHPAYTYEDFVQGIRPRSVDGVITYPVVPGRFLRFCQQAEDREGRCVLVIDEINRANLAQVFGELMYLLEYREQQIALASGDVRFRIPANVRILGTMNTADRSIALVDHALRRRFALIHLAPNYEALRRYHARAQSGFDAEPLIQLMTRLNRLIGERDYALGISYFLRESVGEEIGDIWQMEIEPYLEEYFFDRPEHVEEYRWQQVRGELGYGT